MVEKHPTFARLLHPFEEVSLHVINKAISSYIPRRKRPLRETLLVIVTCHKLSVSGTARLCVQKPPLSSGSRYSPPQVVPLFFWARRQASMTCMHAIPLCLDGNKYDGKTSCPLQSTLTYFSLKNRRGERQIILHIYSKIKNMVLVFSCHQRSC